MKAANNVHNKRKQSVIVGGLISTAGLFFAKFLGLFYAIPFNSILNSNDYTAIYGVAFSIYNYVLNICLAGVPFAIAALVAKYSSRGDYQTTLLVKKIATTFMIGFGFVAMLLMIVCATPFAPLLLPDNAAGDVANNIEIMRNVLMVVAIAVFFVPILSASRGFYQGLKHMEVYALSQVLEQIARVAFLLISSAIAVYLLQLDRVWAVYLGAFSTSVAAILAIIHIRLYDRRQMKLIQVEIKKQTVVPNTDKQSIFRELLFISIPYLFVAVLGYSDSIINTFFLNNGMEAYYLTHGGGVEVSGMMTLSDVSRAELTTIISAINYSIVKLMSIPMVLAPGFSSAILPHITSALVNKDYKLVRKNIRDCIDTVLYIGMPICFCLFVFAKPIYAILFPPAEVRSVTGELLLSSEAALELCANVLRWFSIEAFLSTLGPIFTSLLMAVELRKLNVRNLTIIVSVKFIITYPLLMWFGYPGLIFSSLISMGLFFFLDGYALTRKFKINWKATYHRILVILGGMVLIYGVASLCSMAGLKGYDSGRMMGIIQLGISGTLSMVAYFAFTYVFGLPQTILHFDIKKLMNRGKGS